MNLEGVSHSWHARGVGLDPRHSRRCFIPCGEAIAVLGDGKLGLLIALVLNAHGYNVRLFGRHEEKLRIAADAGVGASIETPPRAGFDWVVDATGSPDGLRSAASSVRPRGTVVLKSTVHGEVPVDSASIIVNEITLIGSRCGRFDAALPLLDHALIPVERMIAARYPLSAAPEALAQAAQRGTLKVLLSA